MEALPDNVHSHFMKGKHTFQISVTQWSGIWSYVGTEVSYTGISKRAPGIIEQSTNITAQMLVARLSNVLR